MNNRPLNLRIIETAKHEDACNVIAQNKGAVHATNGTYMYPAEKIVGKLLGGFQLVKERYANDGDTFLIGVNSDKSMANLMEEKRVKAGAAVAETFDDQVTRAERVGVALALMHPERKIVVAFYDEATPTALYDTLKQKGLDMGSIHKFGYGTKPGEPGIEGAHNFRNVLAFPAAQNPVCYEITKTTVGGAVFKLAEEWGNHLAPYMASDEKVLFPVPAALAQYRDTSPQPAQYALMTNPELSSTKGNVARGIGVNGADSEFEKIRSILKDAKAEMRPFPASSGLAQTFFLVAEGGAALAEPAGAALLDRLNGDDLRSVVKTAYRRTPKV